MSFPLNPVDGQTYTTVFGSSYKYIASDNKWIKAGITVYGVTGLQGITGLIGATGIQGQTGIQGPTGLKE